MFVYTFQAMWRHRPLKKYSVFVGIRAASTFLSLYTLRCLILCTSSLQNIAVPQYFHSLGFSIFNDPCGTVLDGVRPASLKSKAKVVLLVWAALSHCLSLFYCSLPSYNWRASRKSTRTDKFWKIRAWVRNSAVTDYVPQCRSETDTINPLSSVAAVCNFSSPLCMCCCDCKVP